jgi:ribosomal protein S18 acetylase RimI-like enzyme
VATDYSIRLAAEADVEMLVDFTLREAAEAEGARLTIEQALRGVRGGFATPPCSTYWVAEAADGTMVASTSIVKEWSNFHGGHYWWIQSLYIVPDHRGSGLVKQLIGHLASVSRSAGALDLRLYVHSVNRRAIRAYRRCGFVEAPYSIMTLPPPNSASDHVVPVAAEPNP